MPERQRLQAEMRRIHLQQRRVLEEVVAEHVRVGARAVAEHDVDGARLTVRLPCWAFATTCEAVTISPRRASTTKPLPAVWSSTPKVASIVTTPLRDPA